jgi:hypothetical protein
MVNISQNVGPNENYISMQLLWLHSFLSYRRQEGTANNQVTQRGDIKRSHFWGMLGSAESSVVTECCMDLVGVAAVVGGMPWWCGRMSWWWRRIWRRQGCQVIFEILGKEMREASQWKRWDEMLARVKAKWYGNVFCGSLWQTISSQGWRIVSATLYSGGIVCN